MESQGFPTSTLFQLIDGRLVRTPRYGENGPDDILPENYALVYSKNVGKPGSSDIMAKVFIIKNGDRKIKEFYSTKYQHNPKFLRENVEIYISNQLSSLPGSSQTTLQLERKRKNNKVKPKRCKCNG